MELVPREGKVLDKPPSFPPLLNLHLELMENKTKLKKNLPLIKVSAKKPVPLPVASSAVLAASAGVTKAVAGSKTKETVTTPEGKPAAKEESKAGSKAQSKVGSKAGSKASSKQGSPEPKGDKKKKKAKKGEETPIDEDLDLLGELGGTPKPDAQPDPEPIDEPAPGEKDELEDGLGEDLPPGAAEVPDAEPGGGEKDGEPEEEDEYAGMTPEEKEAYQKEEYIWRFKIMKKKYKNKNIPDFNEHDDLHTMKTTYERTKKDIELDVNVETYKNYLVGGFMITEFICTNWMEIDFEGFTAQQMMVMEKYESLLIELGERSYNRWHMNLPIEVRLIGFIIIQAGLFYLGKIIAAKSGTTIAELFKGFTGQPSTAAVKAASEEISKDAPPKKKMKGPTIKADDVRKATDMESKGPFTADVKPSGGKGSPTKGKSRG